MLNPIPLRYLRVIEVLLIFLLGSWLTQYFFQLADIRESPFSGFFAQTPNYREMSSSLLLILTLQYAAWLLCALAIYLVHVVTKSGCTPRLFKSEGPVTIPLSSALLFIVCSWAVIDVGFKGVAVIDGLLDIGQTTQWRDAWLSAERTWGWWLFTAVGSFGVVVVFEELFWRGVIQRWLMKSVGAPGAVILTSALFTLSHSQYHSFDFG